MTSNSPKLDLFSYAAKIKRPLILDGAMGSVLRQKYAPHQNLWMSDVNLRAPEAVINLHKKYVKAGADIITTNTFRTNPLALETDGAAPDDKDIVKKSVLLAVEASFGKKVLVAGSNAPAEDCYKVKRDISSKKLAYNHYKHIDLLIDSGCNFILNETQSHLDEILIICKYCSKNKIPFIVSLFFDKDLKILSGEGIVDVIKLINDYSPLSISFNCIKPEALTKLLKRLKPKYKWGAYMNCGLGAHTDSKIKSCLAPVEYLKEIENILPYSPSFVGACCGSTPQHIKLIKEYFDEKH